MPSKRRQPSRTCIGCRTATEKRSLLRVVRTPEGDVRIDTSGKMPGRGAYICAVGECLEQAFASQRLDSALRHPLGPAARQVLKEELARHLAETR